MKQDINEVMSDLNGLAEAFYGSFSAPNEIPQLQYNLFNCIEQIKSLEKPTSGVFGGNNIPSGTKGLKIITTNRLKKLFGAMKVGQSVLMVQTNVVRDDTSTNLWLALAKTKAPEPVLYLTEQLDEDGSLKAGEIFDSIDAEIQQFSIENGAAYPLGDSPLTLKDEGIFAFILNFLLGPWVFSTRFKDAIKPQASCIYNPLEFVGIAASKESSGGIAKMDFKRVIAYFFTEAFIMSEAKLREKGLRQFRTEIVAELLTHSKEEQYIQRVLGQGQPGVRAGMSLFSGSIVLGHYTSSLIDIQLELTEENLRQLPELVAYNPSETIVCAKEGVVIMERDTNYYGEVLKNEKGLPFIGARNKDNLSTIDTACAALTAEVGPLSSCYYETLIQNAYCAKNLMAIQELGKASWREFANELLKVLNKTTA